MIAAKAPIEPTRIYSVLETAELLGVQANTDKARKEAVYRIDDAELPRTRTTANGGCIGYLGAEILRYLCNRTVAGNFAPEDLLRLSRFPEETVESVQEEGVAGLLHFPRRARPGQGETALGRVVHGDDELREGAGDRADPEGAADDGLR